MTGWSFEAAEQAGLKGAWQARKESQRSQGTEEGDGKDGEPRQHLHAACHQKTSLPHLPGL